MIAQAPRRARTGSPPRERQAAILFTDSPGRSSLAPGGPGLIRRLASGGLAGQMSLIEKSGGKRKGLTWLGIVNRKRHEKRGETDKNQEITGLTFLALSLLILIYSSMSFQI